MPNDAIPIQPVPRPILCNPYEEPRDHWHYNKETGQARQMGTRRPAGYWYKDKRVGAAQAGLFPDEQFDDLPLVNLLREDIRRWREADYRGASRVTADLLRHWSRADRPRRLFFCQREAVETIIYLAELRLTARTGALRFKPGLTDDDLARLLRAERPSFRVTEGGGTADWFPRLIDAPGDADLLALRRLGCKMATGSGKTVVMAMLIAWAFCNRAQNPLSAEFPSGVLIVCPNRTIRERLQVLRPEDAGNYYDQFDIVPSRYRDGFRLGRVIVENWHQLAPASEHSEGDKSYRVVNKGEEDPDAFARRVLKELYDRAPIMVLNDEGHHCYRVRTAADDEAEGREPDDELVGTAAGQQEDLEEARVWLDALDKINNAFSSTPARGTGVPPVSTPSTTSRGTGVPPVTTSSSPTRSFRGILFCLDLSATPFYIKGSGNPEGSPFPWLVSDFGLVDAIESGIVKIPRLPVSDTTGRPDPKYFRLWKDHIVADLQPGEKYPGRGGGRPKPPVVYRKAEGALKQLASQWKDRFEKMREATPGQEHVPPVMIIVCDNTEIAAEFYRRISGETEEIATPEEAAEVLGGEDEEDAEPRRAKPKGSKPRIAYGPGAIFPEYFSNTADRKYTIRIDSKLLKDAESDDPTRTVSDAAEALRRVVATVGKVGEPGEHVRCVVSVAMLTEGWDASNVTHILGLRAFGSQLLCEQVVGRGLRRLDYKPDPGTGLLTEEYVDVYGIPFSVIPYKGKPEKGGIDNDRPKNHVHAMPERAALRMEFPVVEGYVFALRKNLIRCDVGAMDPLQLEPNREPTATFMRITTGYAEGAAASKGSPFPTVRQDREAYYRDNHIETIKFEIARHVLDRLLSGAGDGNGADKKSRVFRLQSRHQLFPQVYRHVDEYIARKVDFRGLHESELGLEQYARQIVERLADRIEPDDGQGEPPLLPVLNRIKPIASTDDVDFKTVKPVVATQKSHVNQVVLDTTRWEQAAVFELDSSGSVAAYVRNTGLEMTIPYEHLGISHHYVPDFLVRLDDGTTVIVEVKGYEDNEDRAKHDAARKWVQAVNNWGRLGRWGFHVCRDPALLGRELGSIHGASGNRQAQRDPSARA